MKIKGVYYVFGVLVFISFIYGILEINHSSVLKDKIKVGFEVVVLEKFNPKEWSEINTQLRVKDKRGKVIELPFRSEIIDYVSIGDRIIKVKDENLCYVKKPGGESKAFYYVRVSMKTRNHWTFPIEWREKWMESSDWDK